MTRRAFFLGLLSLKASPPMVSIVVGPRSGKGMFVAAAALARERLWLDHVRAARVYRDTGRRIYGDLWDGRK